MAQAQKHWVQAMLNEDTYTPFPYFYDVTAWSQPLLFNVRRRPVRCGADTGRDGRCRRWPAPAEPPLPADAPTVAVWQMTDGTDAIESGGWLRWLLDKRWRLPHDDVTAGDIAAGALAGSRRAGGARRRRRRGEKALGKKGVQALRGWVAAGGRLVGLSGGAALAGAARRHRRHAGLADLRHPGLAGARLGRRPGRSTAGVGSTVWNFVEYDPVLRASRPGHRRGRPTSRADASRCPASPMGEDELVGTAAVTDERYAAGRVVLFASDPNFRAFTDGTQKILRNAVLGRRPGHAAATDRRRPRPRPPRRPSRWPTSVATCSSRSGRRWRTARPRCSRRTA